MTYTWIAILYRNYYYRSGLVVWRHELSAPPHTENRDGSMPALTARHSLLPSPSAVPLTDLRSTVRSTCQCRFCAVLVSASRPCKRLSKTISALKVIRLDDNIINHNILQSENFYYSVFVHIIMLSLILLSILHFCSKKLYDNKIFIFIISIRSLGIF